MPASRAALVLRLPSGAQVFVNDSALATQFLSAVASSGQHVDTAEEEIVERASVVGASIQAHADLNKLSGKDHHFMGDALRDCRGLLPASTRSALRNLQRLANVAKHQWHESGQDSPRPGPLAASTSTSATPRTSSPSPSGPAVETIIASSCVEPYGIAASQGEVPSQFFIGEERIVAHTQTECSLANTVVLTQEQFDERVQALAIQSSAPLDGDGAIEHVDEEVVPSEVSVAIDNMSNEIRADIGPTFLKRVEEGIDAASLFADLPGFLRKRYADCVSPFMSQLQSGPVVRLIVCAYRDRIVDDMAHLYTSLWHKLLNS